MVSTRFTDLVGCSVPIQLAPMGGGIITPEMASAVAAAGAHAMFGVANAPPPVAAAILDDFDKAGARPLGANFLVPFANPAVVELVASRVGVVDFYLGHPDRKLVDLVHSKGALAGWQVTVPAKAVAAAEAGCDLVIAHGIEAGGRNPGGIGLIPLLAQVLEEVDIPVVAAGGIATARGVAAALAAGADAVRLGTRFLASTECGAHPKYIEALLAARAEDTVHTPAFHVFFPPEPAELAYSRVLRSALQAAEKLEADTVGEMQMGPERLPLPRFAAPPPVKSTIGHVEAMALYAGQSAGLVREVKPAGEIVEELWGGAQKLLERWA
jgi:nitronate monooxygenase